MVFPHRPQPYMGLALAHRPTSSVVHVLVKLVLVEDLLVLVQSFCCIGLRFRLGRVQDESTLGVLFVTS
jgi:hypothetical protein